MSFGDQIRQFTADAEKKATAVPRAIALNLQSRIIKRSPVDTGRFRANNSISLNDIPQNEGTTDTSPSTAESDANSTLGSFKLGDTIFVYNNLAYALPLEYGWSQQAPQGVYRVSFEDMKTHLAEIVKNA